MHRCLVARRMEGGIREDAPIVSRIYQVISDGMLGFENAYKLANTPFPFPYAQCVIILIYFHAIIVTPLVMVAWLQTPCLVGVMSLLSVLAYYMLNEVAREIEEPYRYDPNNLPLSLFHHRFNARLVTALCKSLIPDSGIMHHLDPVATKMLVEASRPQIVEWWHLEGNRDEEDPLCHDSWTVKTRMATSTTPETNSAWGLRLPREKEEEGCSEDVEEDQEDAQDNPVRDARESLQEGRFTSMPMGTGDVILEVSPEDVCKRN
ncbi:hypothetical protein CBR_g39960 [Chara braunii]|uniref:Uncharacterized protein n=1 Tax=Chara braunii TaxID=69332 RepID=A0A388K1N7_CHABU|nr:hypothetical protein CBR_g39960 [Chara braunii]|eukprot:GBG63956.1 hypothetical protein CBR_g39960 [Chara braunii]